MSHLADHITMVLLCGEYAGSLKVDNLIPVGDLKGRNLHFVSELEEKTSETSQVVLEIRAKPELPNVKTTRTFV